MARIGSAPYKINASFTEVSPGVWQGDYDYGKTSTPAASTTATAAPATTSVPSQLSPYEQDVIAHGSGMVPSSSSSTPPSSSNYSSYLSQLNAAQTVDQLNNVLFQIQYSYQRKEISDSQWQTLRSTYQSRQTSLAATAATRYENLKSSVANATSESQANSILATAKTMSDQGLIAYSQYRNIQTLVSGRIAALKTQQTTTKGAAPDIYNQVLDKMNAFVNAKSLSGLQGLITEVNIHKSRGVLSEYQASSLINQIQSKISSLKIGDTAIFNQLVQLIKNTTSITALASALTQVNSQYTAGNIDDNQLKQLQELYTAKYKELQTKVKEGDDLESQMQRFQSFVSALQQVTSLTQLESIKAQIEASRTSGGISSSQYSQLLSLYTSIQSQLEKQKQTASRFKEFYAIIQNATSVSSLSYLPSQMQMSVQEGTLSANEYTSLSSLLQQKISQLQQQEAETTPTIQVELPTATQIYSAPDLQVLSNYESQLDRAVKLNAIDQTQYIILSNAISMRRSQLFQDQQAETTPMPAAATPSQTIVTIAPQAPAPSYQQPSVPTIVQTAPSVISAPSPAPIIYSPPSQVVSPIGSGQPAQAPDWSFMTPDEGPPLPRSLGIRWPWYKKPVAG